MKCEVCGIELGWLYDFHGKGLCANCLNKIAPNKERAMQKFTKVGEFYTEDNKNDKKVISALETVGYNICWLDEYGNGNHYVIMEADHEEND